jgi:hypothetical protein
MVTSKPCKERISANGAISGADGMQPITTEGI